MPPGSPASVNTRFVHFDLGKDVPTGIAGYYTPEREVRLIYRGREVLYVTGQAVLEASCCGTGRWRYATITGYVERWHSASEMGRPVSEVQPIDDERERTEIRKIIEDRESAERLDAQQVRPGSGVVTGAWERDREPNYGAPLGAASSIVIKPCPATG